RLVHLGVPPGGPRAGLMDLEGAGTPWFRAFDPPEEEMWHPLDLPIREQQRPRYRSALAHSMGSLLSGSEGRDLESTQTAWLVPAGTPSELTEITASVLRILLISGRWTPQERSNSFASVLSNHAKDYLQRYSRLHGMSLAQVQSAVESQLERLFVNNLLPLGAVDLPIEVHPPGDLLWECGFCGRVHLHMSGGVCTRPGCV